MRTSVAPAHRCSRWSGCRRCPLCPYMVPWAAWAVPLPYLPPPLSQLYTDCLKAGVASSDVGLIVIGKKLLKETGRCICSGLAPVTKSVNRTITSDLSVSSCSQTSTGGASPVSHITSCSASPSCATGLSTEHSSIYSWRYDEFDRVNTQRVRQLFCDVDELLYEGKVASHSEGLQEECEEWNGHSPHLRILGNQLDAPKQEGYQYVHRRASSVRSAVSSPCLEKREGNSELCVEGRRLGPDLSSLQSAFGSRLALSDHCLSRILEEVYEAEGRIEEFLAYDVKETEDEGVDQRKTASAPARAGVPPVSPHACIRDAVANEVFDDVWHEVVRMLEELLHKHWESELTALAANGIRLRGCLETSSQSLYDPPSHMPLRGHRVASSRASNTKSAFLWSSCNPTQDPHAFKMNLNGVMTIQAKPLQQRQQGFAEKSPTCDPDDRASMLLCGRAQGQRVVSALSHKPPAQRRLPRLSARPRLLHSQPSYSNEVLRGTRLSTVTEGLPSPRVSTALNQRLPHIHSDTPEQELTLPVPRHMQHRGRLLRGGVVSALQPVSSLPPLRAPSLMLESLSRPNTTHTFWSDTPMKRSFTPMDFACNMRTGRGLFTVDRGRMGVTGFSMGITCSAASGFSECRTPPRRRTHMPSSAEEDGANGPLLIGAQYQRKVLSRFPGHGRKKIQVVMP